MRADEAARWCGRGDCGHTGLIEVIAVELSGGVLRPEYCRPTRCLAPWFVAVLLGCLPDQSRLRLEFQDPQIFFVKVIGKCVFRAMEGVIEG
jgi:hypothetical protein